MSFQVLFSSNATAILRQLAELPSRMAVAIAKAMDFENQRAITEIQVNYLRGPRPEKLGVVTDKLSRSLRASKAVVEGNSVESIVGTNQNYAAVHEFGFDGNVNVRGFTRKNPQGNRSQQVASVSLVSGRIRKTQRQERTASGISVVKPFSRHMKMPARPYLAPGLTDHVPAYSAAVSRAIETAWNEGAVSP